MSTSSRPLAAGIALAISLPFTAFCAHAVWGAMDDRALEPVEGEVISVESDRSRLLVRSNSPSAASHETELRLAYRYVHGGTSFEGDRYAFDAPHQTLTDEEEANAFLEAHPPGASISVWVDPRDPRRAVRRKRELERPLVFGGLSALVLLGSLLGVGRWLVGRSSVDSASTHPAP